MKKINELEKLKPDIIKILKKNKAKRAGIFGSYARNEQRDNSDIDILVELPKNLNLFDFIGIKQELEDAIKKRVDLVEYSTIKSLIKKTILKEEIKIL